VRETNELAQDAFAGRGRDELRMTTDEALRLVVEARSELVFEPGGAQEADRICGKDLRRDRPNDAGLQIGAAAVRVDRLSAAKRGRNRVDREVASPEVGLDPVWHRREVHRPAVPEGHPPGTVAVGEREDGAAREGPIGTRCFGRRRARDVDVDDGPPEQLVPYGPADDIRLVADDGLEDPLIHRRPASRHARAPSGFRR
jgi:hypothetical protein